MIGIIGSKNEDISDLLSSVVSDDHKISSDEDDRKTGDIAANKQIKTVTRSIGERIFISPRAKMVAQLNDVDFSALSGTGPDGYIIENDIKFYVKNSAKATPLARKIAGIENISLSDVQGTGARGKIVKLDVMQKANATERQSANRNGTKIPYAGMRKVIAEKMSESLHTAAQATHKIKVDMSEAAKLKDTFKNANKKVSYNDVISFAVCRSLKDIPIMNSELTSDGILVKDYVNLGIAVAIDNGLIVPVINDADLMSIEEIGLTTRQLARKAKNGQLKPDEYKGSSFTISNLGMFGLESFTAIINPPESGIIAVGKIEKTPVVVDDEIVIRLIMCLTLTYDHRVVDGAPAAQFLAKVKEYLEKPYLLL